jgi:hypothetical protein
MAQATYTAHHPDTVTERGRVSWGAIIAGAVVGVAAMLVLALLGLGIGAAVIEPGQPGGATNGVGTMAPIWIIISQIISLGIAGAIAGRLAGAKGPLSAALHGATVWGLATVATVWLATSAATGAANLMGTMVGGLASGTRSAVETIVPDNLSVPSISDIEFSFDDLPPEIQSRLRQQGMTPENFQSEMREAFNAVISPQERTRARDAARQTLTDALRNPATAPQQIEELLDRVFGQILSEEDRQEALNQLQQRFGISPEEAESYLQTLEQRAEELRTEARQTVENVRTQAVEAADAAADATSKAAVFGVIASALGLAAAMGAAYAARPDRYTY